MARTVVVTEEGLDAALRRARALVRLNRKNRFAQTFCSLFGTLVFSVPALLVFYGAFSRLETAPGVQAACRALPLFEGYWQLFSVTLEELIGANALEWYIFYPVSLLACVVPAVAVMLVLRLVLVLVPMGSFRLPKENEAERVRAAVEALKRAEGGGHAALRLRATELFALVTVLAMAWLYYKGYRQGGLELRSACFHFVLFALVADPLYGFALELALTLGNLFSLTKNPAPLREGLTDYLRERLFEQSEDREAQE